MTSLLLVWFYSELYQPAVYSLKEDGSFEVVDEDNSEKVIHQDVMCLLATAAGAHLFIPVLVLMITVLIYYFIYTQLTAMLLWVYVVYN